MKKKLVSLILATVMGMSSITFPPDMVKAEEVIQEYVAEEQTERGEYVVCMEDTSSSVEQIENLQEIVNDTEEKVYEADLSQKEIQELEETEDILVEENFFLTGAKSKKSKARDKRKEKSEQKRDLSERNTHEEAETKCTDWNYQMINADGVSEQIEESESAVKVAILDSGIELLSDVSVHGAVNLVDEEQDLPYYMNDMTGHGTAVADIVHQICPQAEIYSVRVLDRENRGRLSDVVEGIYWCIEQDMDIINMSFGTPNESEILRNAIQAASEAGIMIIGAVGNGGSEATVEYPASFEEVVAVGAVNTVAEKTEESATGAEVELVAPGEEILTESMFGMETVSSGTSMAVPHVTGAAALLMCQDAGKTAKEIRAVLDASGNPLGNRDEYGYGLVDVEYASELLLEDTETIEKICNEKDDEVVGLEQKNRENISTFEDVDYVEGRWHRRDHERLISNVMKYSGEVTFNAKEIKLLKAGAIYPDKPESGMQGSTAHPEWHGYHPQNYVANYIFATKIAKNAGATSDLTKAKGQSNECYNRMVSTISKSGINGLAWKDIIMNYTGLDYASQNAETKKKWRKLFLYGMAAHTASDAYAHSSFYKDEKTGQMIRLTHNAFNDWADNVDKYKARFLFAEDIVHTILWLCENNLVGEADDFTIYEINGYKKFYLGNILKYSIEADKYNRVSWLTDLYQSHNYTL